MRFRLILLLAFVVSGQSYSAEYLIKLKKNMTLSKSKTSLYKVKEKFKTHYSDFAVIEVDSKLKNPLSLKQDPAIEVIEKNQTWSIVNTPIDPDFGSLWGLSNTGNNEPNSDTNGAIGADINALKAWEITKGSKDIVIAVIDTGIDYNHPDLKDNIWVNEAERDGVPGVDDDGNGYIDDIHGYDFVNNDGDPVDDQSHGTHCAGTIGASHNTEGVAGVMADVKMMGVKFLSASGSGSTEGAIKAIDYATKMNVDIMSNSWGGGGHSQLLLEAIQRANEKGIIFTAAAGNSGTNNDESPHYPSNYDVENVISVAAHNSKDELAYFSCFGKKTVHVSAPGTNILSTVLNSNYNTYSGTSMATPHVSGVIGLYLAQHGKTDPLELRNTLMDSTVYSPSYKKTISRGRVDAFNFLNKVVTEKPEEPKEEDWLSFEGPTFESAHPYAHESNALETYSIAGAKYIRAIYEKIDVEQGYDFLFVYDENDNEISRVSGIHENYATDYVEGDVIKLGFQSDNIINSFGYILKELQYIPVRE